MPSEEANIGTDMQMYLSLLSESPTSKYISVGNLIKVYHDIEGMVRFYLVKLRVVSHKDLGNDVNPNYVPVGVRE